jgi:hypothetical protein
LPDVAGRRRAVFVGLSVAAIVLSVIPFTVSSATAPPGINRFLYALGQVESGGNYYARNASSGAYGKYQIMPSNWPSWAKLYVGSSTAPWTPINQEKVARGKVTALWNWLGSWENVAHWWLTGSGDTNRAHWSTYSKSFVAKVMKIYANVSETTAAADVMAAPPAPPAPTPPPLGRVVVETRRIGEDNVGVAYTGRWAEARHNAYSGGAVIYSERDGATVTYPFYGQSVTWIGPVGPTRGKATVTVDSRVVATVDLRRSSFSARVALFTRTWSGTGNHWIQIKVVGSGRPVAVDEFVITRSTTR